MTGPVAAGDEAEASYAGEGAGAWLLVWAAALAGLAATVMRVLVA